MSRKPMPSGAVPLVSPGAQPLVLDAIHEMASRGRRVTPTDLHEAAGRGFHRAIVEHSGLGVPFRAFARYCMRVEMQHVLRRRHRLRRVRAALQSLPLSQRRALALVSLARLSCEEAARVLACPPADLARAHRAALRALRTVVR